SGSRRWRTRLRSRATRSTDLLTDRRTHLIATPTMVPAAADPVHGRRRRAARTRYPRRGQAAMGYVFSSGYAVLLILFGLIPTLYAIFLAFTSDGAFVGIDNFVKVFNDYRFWPAVQHVAV